jgi:hypothetical protein
LVATRRPQQGIDLKGEVGDIHPSSLHTVQKHPASCKIARNFLHGRHVFANLRQAVNMRTDIGG